MSDFRGSATLYVFESKIIGSCESCKSVEIIFLVCIYPPLPNIPENWKKLNKYFLKNPTSAILNGNHYWPITPIFFHLQGRKSTPGKSSGSTPAILFTKRFTGCGPNPEVSECQECKMAAHVKTELKLILKSPNTKRVQDVMVNI